MKRLRDVSSVAPAVFIGMVLLLGCGPATPTPDLVATELAVRAAADATQTAQAAALGSITPSKPPPTATPSPTLAPSTPQPEATIPVPPTATPAPTTAISQPTPTLIPITILPVDGSDPSGPLRSSFTQINEGLTVLLPGFRPEEIADPVVFRDRINLRVEVMDTNVGHHDGAGIHRVVFQVEDENSGHVVYTKEERNPAYCLFGGDEPLCPALDIRAAHVRWPGTDQPVRDQTYLVRIRIEATSGWQTEWRWRFTVDRGVASQFRARIVNIESSGGRYLVYFETEGFRPQLSGQHVHFFFDTVAPEEAGVPGSGPWKLYGGPSPFTEYTTAERPPGAQYLCILVAHPDHSVQPNTGNCAPLP